MRVDLLLYETLSFEVEQVDGLAFWHDIVKTVQPLMLVLLDDRLLWQKVGLVQVALSHYWTSSIPATSTLFDL